MHFWFKYYQQGDLTPKLFDSITSTTDMAANLVSDLLLFYVSAPLEALAPLKVLSQVSRADKFIDTTKVVENAKHQTFYRRMSVEHWEELLKTNKLSATKETCISPSASYCKKFDGVLVKFTMKSGTYDSLLKIGKRHKGNGKAKKVYPDLDDADSGWTESNTLFKVEGDQVNIGLGQGNGLKRFNENIVDFEVIDN